MIHKLEAFKPRDIAKNAIASFAAVATYKYTKEQILDRTDHDPDDKIVRVGATVAGSTASWGTRKVTDSYIDQIADWLSARFFPKEPETEAPEVPTES